MLQRTLKAEMLKLKHSPVWLAFIVMPVISAVMGTLNYYGNKEVLTSEWYSLWTQHTLFYCYLCFPTLVGVYCAYICRLEHINNNWKSVLAEPVKLRYVYLAKLLTVVKVIIWTQLLVGILFLAAGKLAGFTSGIPKELIGWLFGGMLAGSVMAAVQLGISLSLKSFSVAVGLSLAGGITGLIVGAAGFGLFFPYSLFVIAMGANSPEAGLECHPAVFISTCMILILGFTKLGIMKLKKNMV